MSIHKLFPLMIAFIGILGFLSLAACTTEAEQADGDAEQTTDGDSATDGDLPSDGDATDGDLPGDGDIEDDASEGDEAEGEEACPENETRCSEDARFLEICLDGIWQQEDCWEARTGFCSEGVCLPVWNSWAGEDVFSGCLDDPHANPHSLADKAAHMDKLMPALHIHPNHGLVSSVRLRADYYEDWAANNGTTVGEMSEADFIAAEEAMAHGDVTSFSTGENDGLWSSIYVASQVFRYAVTGEAQALDNIKLSLGGTYRQLLITGTPGVYTREYKTPGVAGMSCPENECSYFPDIGRDDMDKDDNRWVKVEDGCLKHFGGEGATYTSDSECTGEWVTESTCGLEEFNGYCWLDNVSQDEYSGHMMAAALAAKLVDDEEVQTIAKDIFNQVLSHLMENELGLVDHDGLLTEHGRFWAYSLTDYPGFNALFALSWFRAGMTATGREDIAEYYENCLLKEQGPLDCIEHMMEKPDKPYVEYMEEALLLYVGKNACMSNWNNFSMAFLSILPLIMYETDPLRRARYQSVLEEHMIREKKPDSEDYNVRSVIVQNNPMYNFIYAAMRNNSDGPDVAAVNGAICQLRQFPLSKATPSKNVSYENRPENQGCEARNGGYLADTPMEIWQRCPQTNVFWGNPYWWDSCTEDRGYIRPGSDYLYVYWMGRYFGFLSETD